MTNAEIIMRESLALVEQGILATKTAEMVDMNGEVVEMEVPEEIHTFDGWKQMGYVVRKGQHAIAKFPVWSPTKASRKKIAEALENGEEAPKMSMYMRNAAWFKRDQVETVAEAFDKACAKVQAENEAERAKTAEKPKSETKPTGNPYKTAIAAFHKATLKKNMGKRRLFYRRIGKTVYICDSGWYMMKVGLTDYNKYFKGVKEYYKDLNDGDGYSIDNGGSAMEMKLDLREIYDNCQEKATTKCEVLDFTEPTAKGEPMRALKCGDTIITVNDDYLKAMGGTAWKGCDPLSAIVSKNAVILPIRHDKEFEEHLNKAA